MPQNSGLFNLDFNTELKRKGFMVYPVKCEDYKFQYYNRKAFYKICVMMASNIVHYADRTFETDGTILFFGNPRIPYSWKITSSTAPFTIGHKR